MSEAMTAGTRFDACAGKPHGGQNAATNGVSPSEQLPTDRLVDLRAVIRMATIDVNGRIDALTKAMKRPIR